MQQQYTLPLRKFQSYNKEDFIFSECNKDVKTFIDNIQSIWGFEPYPEIVMLIAPKSSGKTHLCNIITNIDPTISVLDNIDNKDEEEILHFFNLCHENHHKAFFTSTQYKHLKLPDLKSRLSSIRSIHINSPDDEMVRSLLVKSFTERSIKVSNDVIKFLLTRIPRSFASIENTIEMIDKLSMEQKRNINVAFLSSIKLHEID